MYQQQLSDYYNKLTYFNNKEKVIHVCDRCGEELHNIDFAVYFDLTDRNGATVIRQELCYNCAMELCDWAEKKGEDD